MLTFSSAPVGSLLSWAVTILFWGIVAFIGWLFWSGKYKLIFMAANPTAAVASLGKDAVYELANLIWSRMQSAAGPGPIENPEFVPKDPSPAVPAGITTIQSYIGNALEITHGLPEKKQIEFIKAAPSNEALWKMTNAYLLDQLGMKQSKAEAVNA